MVQSRWLTAQRWRRACHQEKKKEAKKEVRKADLAYLTDLAEQNQGFALVPSEKSGASRQDLHAEALALARQQVEKQLAEAKAQRDAAYEAQLGKQQKLTRFFAKKKPEPAEEGGPREGGPEEGSGPWLPPAAGVGGAALAGFRGARGPLAPACADPGKAEELEQARNRKTLERRVSQLRTKEQLARTEAAKAAKQASTPDQTETKRRPRGGKLLWSVALLERTQRTPGVAWGASQVSLREDTQQCQSPRTVAAC